MKKLLLISSLLLNVVAVIIIIRCYGTDRHDRSGNERLSYLPLGATAGFAAANKNYSYASPCDSTDSIVCTNCYSPACCDTPLKTVGACFAQKMVNNYRVNHWAADNALMPISSTNRKDSRSVWFSLNTLKRFIYEVESKTCLLQNLPGGGHPDLGVRFYFAEYPDVAVWDSFPELANWKDYANDGSGTGAPVPAKSLYANLHTLILIPTYHDNAHNLNVDFDPNTGGGFTCAVANEKKPAPVILMPEILNHGDMIPPPWTCTNAWCSGATFMGFADDDVSDYTAASDPFRIGLKPGKTCP